MERLNETLNKIKPIDKEAIEKAQKHLDNLTKPKGSLGVLEDVVKILAGITQNPFPKINKKVIIVMAADHGVTEEGVSAFPKEVTTQMVFNFLSGGAAINVLTRHAGGQMICCDIGVAGDIDHKDIIKKKVKYGTDNMTKGPAMSLEEAIKAIEVGIEVAEEEIKKGATLLATGEMGIGNTTASSAILKTITNCPTQEAVGRGTGIDDKRLLIKLNAVETAIKINKPNKDDGLDILSKVGGLEIAGLVGVILAGAANRVPIVIDGFISTAAALIVSKLSPESINYIIASHVSEEPGHKLMLEYLGLHPMLHMKMRLGEGTGAVLAFNIIESATKIQREMATFQSAGVSQEI